MTYQPISRIICVHKYMEYIIAYRYMVYDKFIHTLYKYVIGTLYVILKYNIQLTMCLSVYELQFIYNNNDVKNVKQIGR